MYADLTFTLLVLILSNFQRIETHEQCLLQQENDLLTDCNCRISDLNKLNNQRLHPLLWQIVHKNYFRFFPVNLRKKCQFWSDNSQCSLRTCAIKPCSVENLPEGLRDKSATSNEQCAPSETTNRELSSINKNLTEEQRQTIEAWTKFDDTQTNNFCDIDDETSVDLEYIDLSTNLERYTGYTGPSTQRVWSAIYNENCFFLPDSEVYYNLRQKRLHTDKMCLEGRTFYRLISGLHTSISVHLCAQYFFPAPAGGYTGFEGQWRPNFEEFRRRFDPSMTEGEGPKWLKNIYFIYLIELEAIYKASNILMNHSFFTGNATDDLETKTLITDRLLNEIEPFAAYFDEKRLFQNEKAVLKVTFRDHFRNISHIMDCVGCDKCKLWGKLQTQGLGNAIDSSSLVSSESCVFNRNGTENSFLGWFDSTTQIRNCLTHQRIYTTFNKYLPPREYFQEINSMSISRTLNGFHIVHSFSNGKNGL